MAVTSVIRTWQGRKVSTDEKGVRTLAEVFAVETDSDSTGGPAVVDGVIAAYPWAVLYGSHIDWPKAVCRKLDANPNGGPRVWLVNAAFSSAPFEAAGDGSGEAAGAGGSGDAAGNGSSPNAAQSNSTPADQRPATITITKREVTEPLVEDAVTGDPRTNTVGDPFDPPEEVIRSRHVITWKIFRTLDQLSWDTRSQFLDTVNWDNVLVFGKLYPAYSLRCTDYSIDTVWETGETGLKLYFAITVVAEHDPKLWKLKTLNTGRRRANFSDATQIVDDAGQPVADPVPLDEDGFPLTFPLVPPAAYHYVEGDGYLPKIWNGSGGKLYGAGGLIA